MLKTVADWITAARFILSIILFYFLWAAEITNPAERSALAWTCFVLFVVAAITDLLDGAVARATELSEFGRVADPFVDKVLVVGTLVFLAAIPETRKYIQTWAVVTIVAREFFVTGVRGFAEAKGMAFPADAFGKLKMVLQCMSAGGGLLCLAGAGAKGDGGIMSIFWEHVPEITVAVWWLTLVVTVGSGISYFVRAWKFLSTRNVSR